MSRKPAKFRVYDTQAQFCEGEGIVKASWARAMEAIMAAMQQYMTRGDYNAAIRQIKAEIRALDL